MALASAAKAQSDQATFIFTQQRAVSYLEVQTPFLVFLAWHNLQRYFHLLCFAAYLNHLEIQDGSVSITSLEEYLNQHPEIRNLAKEIMLEWAP